jgi:hypothetical protein
MDKSKKPEGWALEKQSCIKVFITIALAMPQKTFYTILLF